LSFSLTLFTAPGPGKYLQELSFLHIRSLCLYAKYWYLVYWFSVRRYYLCF